MKGRADFVTQVDIRVQEYMRNELSKRWPDVQFMGEEKDNSDIDLTVQFGSRSSRRHDKSDS